MVQSLEELLDKQGVHPAVISEILATAEWEGGVEESASIGLSKVLSFDPRLPRKQNVIALVGPTGVGKTTTIAKLAARIRAAFDYEIALVSADHYRVGAGYHLKTYAELLNMPFTQIRRIEDLDLIQDKFAHYDLILVDTPGYSPRDHTKIKELGDALAERQWIEKILTLPAPGNEHDLRAAANAFGRASYERIIISKLDESGFIGPVVNTAVSMKKPIAFLTTGQNVPEDIEPASARRLSWMLTRILH